MRTIPERSANVVSQQQACSNGMSHAGVHILVPLIGAMLLGASLFASMASAASPCDSATHPSQCGWFDSGTLPPFVQDAIVAKGGVTGAGNVLVLTSGDPADPDSEISNDVGQSGCGTNPDGWDTFDCVLMDSFVPPTDSVVLALSSEWFEWYQTIFTDWMTIAGAGVPTVDVSINSWINNKVDIIPYGPSDTGVVLLTSLSSSKMVNFRVADSGDHIYDTAIVVVPATWFAAVNASNTDPTLLCGDNKLDPGEECDDGNNVSDDGCSTLCLGTQPPPAVPPSSVTCGNLVYTWPNGSTSPYTCGADLCAGFRCVVGNTISPACYLADQCASACAGACVDVQTAQLDCTTMCTVQPPANQPPPVLPATCSNLVYAWPDGTTMPYTCDDTCDGKRCVIGTTISPECFTHGDCDETTCPGGECVNTPTDDCESLCAKGDLPASCAPEEEGLTRPAANQQGPCFGNVEICSSNEWKLTDESWQIDDERCNGIDDDCNGIVDDMFVTCGDFGLCQNTVNTCDPSDPSNPVKCNPLPAPSPFEICNNGLDDDCEGSIDDGCECGDDECMPGEDYANCPADCPPPPNETPCEDGDLCTTGEAWHNGVCNGGSPVSCDDGNACLVDVTCNPSTGCSATKLNCDDNNPCTLDTCDVAAGCVNTVDPACGGVDADGDGYAPIADGGTDCDDNNGDVHPGAVELCNGIDDNCDSATDEGFDTGSACQSEANECGDTSAGTLFCTPDGLGVVCDATIPANPAGYGDPCSSLPNACGGTGAGTIGCNGTCDALTPPNPAGYGDACNSTPNVCGVTGSGTIGCDTTCSAITPVASDTDRDGTADCIDGCASDPAKRIPGACGCGVPDTDSNGNGVADCLETLRADLAMSVAQDSKTATAGKQLKFQLTVTNLGPARATPEVTVLATITGALTDLRLPSGCTGTAAGITCSLADLSVGRHKDKTITVVPAAHTTITVTATASSPVLDPNTANQTAVAVSVVQ